MKNIVTFIFIIASFNAFSQINSPNGSNIFSYNGLADVTFRFTDRGSGGRAFVHADYNVLALNFENDFSGGTRIGNDVYFKDRGNSFIASGNFGIGTTNPLAKLEVRNGNIIVRNFENRLNESAIMIAHSISIGDYDTFGTSVRTFTESADANIYALQFFTQQSHQTGQTEKLRIQGNGNVGIGTTKPDSKLTVAGNIHAQEVKVTINAGLVPDYVFANDYKLKSLQEVEDYIKQNSHLPEIPSATEIEKNGLMLAEMNLSLLKTIEEMTLYMIEQNKKIENQILQIEQIKKENESFKIVFERLSKIEQKLK
ncbi:tail fiber protein [Flavobacterium sp. MEB061]|uniref:tail fiber protein n=1 Tax=Flavobacterium sp. MEB061 TaxID=1587524 RepID=UPI0006985EDC|nr:tail fiber protein [Flavobacterium sp. MEB061]